MVVVVVVVVVEVFRSGGRAWRAAVAYGRGEQVYNRRTVVALWKRGTGAQPEEAGGEEGGGVADQGEGVADLMAAGTVEEGNRCPTRGRVLQTSMRKGRRRPGSWASPSRLKLLHHTSARASCAGTQHHRRQHQLQQQQQQQQQQHL